MHVDPILTPAEHTRSAVAFKGLTALLSPLANVRRGLAAPPEMAVVGGISGGLELGVTHSAAYLAFLRCRSLERGVAHCASECGCTSAVPASQPVAASRAELVGVMEDARRWPIERFAAFFAGKVSAVFGLRRREAHRGIVSFPTANSPPPAEPPEDERMADLFAGDEYERRPNVVPERTDAFRNSGRYVNQGPQPSNGVSDMAAD
jgi:hypothetical protein